MSEAFRKPPFIDPAGPITAALTAEPPFIFRDVTARVFPIKANMARLEFFVHQYLNNDIPRQIAYFRPSLPYVYFMMLNYGSMLPATVQAQNVGWVSQHEVTFTIPLEWWCEENGRMVFKDWAYVSPFIFVDDELSLTTGREVYGWPKVSSKIHTETTLWSEDPRAPTRLFSLETPLFPRTYAGAHESNRVLLQIDRDPGPTFSEFPFDPNNAWSQLSVLPNTARNMFGLIEESLDMVTGLPIRGYWSGWDPNSLLEMSRKAWGNLTCLLPNFLHSPPSLKSENERFGEQEPAEPHFKQITLKQFPAADDPRKGCYQAIVSSRLGIERLNRSGLLGDFNFLRGDPSGGFTVRIYRYTGQPIVESLGLEIAGEEEGEGAPVAIFKPTLPFWTDVDLYYGKGKVICSRTPSPPGGGRKNGSCWINEQKIPPEPVQQSNGHNPGDLPYNTAHGAATQPVGGPFIFRDINLQVYPLLADYEKLHDLLNKSFNDPLKATGMHFKPFGSYVYLTVTGYVDGEGEMFSEANNIGLWAGREVTFSFPVKWYQEDRLISLALVSPFVYRSSGRAVITDRELNGCPTMKATIESPADVWLKDPRPEAGRRKLKVDTPVFPALYLGQRAESRTLLEIDGGDVLSDGAADDWRSIAAGWGEDLIEDLKRKSQHMAECKADVKNIKTLALEVLALGSPINWVHLKNYRDAQDLKHACYQGLVKRNRIITRIRDIREIEQRVHISIHKYPVHPIQQTLGLKPKYLDLRGGTAKEVFQPIRPFWMQVDLEEPLSQVLCWRSNQKDWNLNHPWLSPGSNPFPAKLSQEPYFLTKGKTRVGHDLLGSTACDWPRLQEQTKDWLRRYSSSSKDRDNSGKGRLSYQQAQQSVNNLNEIQIVLESLLSDGQRLRELSKRIKKTKGQPRGKLSRELKELEKNERMLWKAITANLKPDLFIRRDSVGPEWKRVQNRHKELRLFADEWWHVVEPSNPSNQRKRRS